MKTGYLERTPFIFAIIGIGLICSLVMVISGDIIARILGLACAWGMGVATKSIKGN